MDCETSAFSSGSLVPPGPSTSSRTRGEPTASVSPISPPSHCDGSVDGGGDVDRRLVRHHGGEDHVLLHGIADLDVPFDEFGLGDALADIGELDGEGAHHQPSITRFSAPPMRAWTRKIVPLLGVRIGRVPAAHPQNRGFEVIEAGIGDNRNELGAEARGQRRLVDDDAAAGLLHRGGDQVEVERHQRAKVEDLRVDADRLCRRFGDMHHRPIGDHGDGRALAAHDALAERDGIAALRHLAERVLRPRRDRLVVVAVERPVIEALRLEEDHRVVVLDRRDQQALGIVGIGGDDGLQTGDMGEQRFGRLRMRLAAEDAAAGGHPHDERAGEVAGGPVTQSRSLRDDLVVGGIDVVGELDLDHRPQAVGGHADRRADDAAFVDRRVEAAALAEPFLQTRRAAEYAAEIADILAENDDAVVLGHLDRMRIADRLDHCHTRHGRLRDLGQEGMSDLILRLPCAE